MWLLGLLIYVNFFFSSKKRTVILKAFKEDDFQSLGGWSSPTSAAPLSYNSFE